MAENYVNPLLDDEEEDEFALPPLPGDVFREPDEEIVLPDLTTSPLDEPSLPMPQEDYVSDSKSFTQEHEPTRVSDASEGVVGPPAELVEEDVTSPSVIDDVVEVEPVEEPVVEDSISFTGSADDLAALYASEDEDDVDTDDGPESLISPTQLDSYYAFDGAEDEEDPYGGFRIDEVLSDAIDLGASDVDILANQPTEFTILGEQVRQTKYVIPTDMNMLRIQQDLVSNVLNEDFVLDLELDASYVIRRGKHAGRRLRLSVGKSFNNVFLCFRVISDRIPTLEELKVSDELASWVRLPKGLVLMNGATGTGKALHVDDVVPTPYGMRKVGKIAIGDMLFNENGVPTKVVDIHASNDTEHFVVFFKNGSMIRTAGNHLWCVDSGDSVNVSRMVVSTRDLYNKLHSVEGLTWRVPALTGPVQYARQDFSVSPYVMGAVLSNGVDGDVVSGVDESVKNAIVVSGERVVSESIRDGVFYWRVEGLSDKLRELGFSGYADVSNSDCVNSVSRYLVGSVEQRLEFLAGFCDSSSAKVLENGVVEVCLSDVSVLSLVRQVAASLGWSVEPVSNVSSVDDLGYVLRFVPSVQFMNVACKAEVLDGCLLGDAAVDGVSRFESIVDVRLIDDVASRYVCFEVDSPSHLFLCSEAFVPTHNSTTLASMVQQVQLTRAQKIITLERPVEYEYEKNAGKALVVQREIGRDARSFAKGLESAMRQHPNIILVGEVRNQTEVDALIYAADSGHLAISTTHATSASASINRIKGFYQGDDLRRVLSSMGELSRGLASQALLRTPDGKSRFAVREVLSVDDEVADYIAAGNVKAIQKYQDERGITMEHELVKAVRMELATLEEARSKTDRPYRFDAIYKSDFAK